MIWLVRLWALPVTLVGVVMVLIGLPSKVWIESGVIMVRVRWVPALVPRIVAGTYGDIIMFRGEWLDDLDGEAWEQEWITTAHQWRDRVIKHELVHVQQCHRFGAFQLVLYPAASLYAIIRGGNGYRDNYFEKQARGEV